MLISARLANLFQPISWSELLLTNTFECGGAVLSLVEEVAGLADVGPGGAGLCLEADVGLREAGAVNMIVYTVTRLH